MEKPIEIIRNQAGGLFERHAMMKMGVFIPYFGGKFMRALKYPRPECDSIIEPFAGAAGYSVRYYDRNITLIDKSPYICGVWDFLINASSSEIRKLPLMKVGEDVQDLLIPQEAKWLIGFWINQGSSVPKRTMGGRASNSKFGTWGEAPRERLAEQVNHIRHWKIIEGDYQEAPSKEATWFIDPPYQVQGKQYKNIISDYDELAKWCITRMGQVIVCESHGANWLPFEPITTVVGATHKKTTEMIYYFKNMDDKEGA